ncbi:GTP-binding nuclear protein gsp1/Ran [Aspergillus wentii]|nr:GTP-binding nuclear protein gsp1/Ran [Aspergillus wentii]
MTSPAKFKVVLIGDASVGKTTFIHQNVGGSFTSGYHQTKRYEKRVVSFDIIDQPAVDFDVWDIPGGHGRASTRAKYLKDADAAIIMFDLSKRSTLENVVNWHRELMDATGKPIPFVVYGSKKDITGAAREVSPESITWPTEMQPVEFIKGSSRTGWHDLRSPFLALARQLYKDSKLDFVAHDIDHELYEQCRKEMIVCGSAPLPEECDSDL